MIHTIPEFIELWREESKKTMAALHALTDASLSQRVSNDDRTLGRVAWHIVQTLGEILGRTGLVVDGPKEADPVPKTASEIAESYDRAARSLADAVQFAWTNDSLKVEDDMYGERWTRATTLQGLVMHEVHHRGQLTVLMRQAGLKPPSIYGPAREDWAGYGMEIPSI